MAQVSWSPATLNRHQTARGLERQGESVPSTEDPWLFWWEFVDKTRYLTSAAVAAGSHGVRRFLSEDCSARPTKEKVLYLFFYFILLNLSLV
jgi:hypothetical protein